MTLLEKPTASLKRSSSPLLRFLLLSVVESLIILAVGADFGKSNTLAWLN